MNGKALGIAMMIGLACAILVGCVSQPGARSRYEEQEQTFRQSDYRSIGGNDMSHHGGGDAVIPSK